MSKHQIREIEGVLLVRNLGAPPQLSIAGGGPYEQKRCRAEKAPDLGEIRKRIDDIDTQIQTLINERARFAQEVGKCVQGRSEIGGRLLPSGTRGRGPAFGA